MGCGNVCGEGKDYNIGFEDDDCYDDVMNVTLVLLLLGLGFDFIS